MESILRLLPSTGTIILVAVTLIVVRRLQVRIESRVSGRQFRNQMIMILLSAIGLLATILVIPIGDTMRGQLLGFLGILLSAAIALSSTTVLGNAMAGMMMHVVRGFRMGDFIRAGEHFGRVSERGLFHTEIQTEERNLTTIPNLYLVSHPVTTIRRSGTVISTAVSLGYDVPRTRIEELLLEAAKNAGLNEPFVHVSELGDFSTTYRVAGILVEIKRLISARSKLRKCVLDCLHEGGVEIVSPSFMNTRAIASETRFIPKRPQRDTQPETAAEDLVFDKAEEAASLENLREMYTALVEKLGAQENSVKKAAEGEEREQAQRELSRLRHQKERLEKVISEREAKQAEE